MAFEELQDQIKEKLTEAWERVEESPTYNNLREKYETLSPNAQKGLIAGTVLFFALILLSFPYSYYSGSSTYIEEFESNRGLIRSLLKASRIASDTSTPISVLPHELKSRIQNDLSTLQLLPEQVGGVIDLDVSTLGGAVAPASIKQDAVGVSLKKLNLKQVVDIGFQLQKISPSVKMVGLEVIAGSPDPHYFDALYKLVIFSMPSSEPKE